MRVWRPNVITIVVCGGVGRQQLLCGGMLHPTKQSCDVDTHQGHMEQVPQGAHHDPAW